MTFELLEHPGLYYRRYSIRPSSVHYIILAKYKDTELATMPACLLLCLSPAGSSSDLTPKCAYFPLPQYLSHFLLCYSNLQTIPTYFNLSSILDASKLRSHCNKTYRNLGNFSVEFFCEQNCAKWQPTEL